MVGWIVFIVIVIIIVVAVYATGSAVCKIPIIGGMICPTNNPSPTSQCGTDTQGGTGGKASCCQNAAGLCTTNCQSDTDPSGCRIKCMSDRGCTGGDVPCPTSYIINLAAGQTCGGPALGGSACKSKCCAAQQTYCNRVALLPATRAKCMSDRGC